MKPKLIVSLLIFAFAFPRLIAGNNDTLVKIHYLGHCSFLLQFNDTTSVLTDYASSYPYYSSDYNSPIYNIYNFIPDIASFSHQHADHYNPARLPNGVLYTLKNTDTLDFKHLLIKPVRTSEADAAKPDNSSYIFKYKGLTIVHTGDITANMKALGSQVEKEHLKALFPDTIDILMCVMDGVSPFYADAEAFIDLLKPRIVIPMHYWKPDHKAAFIEYLANQNTNQGKNYLIEEPETSDLFVFASDTNQIPVRIVSLDPSPFGETTFKPNNLAKGAATYATSILDVNHSVNRAIDGYSDTRWQAHFSVQNIEYLIKLTAEYVVNGLVIQWPSKISAYKVLTSTDSVQFDTVYTINNNKKPLNDSIVFDQRNVRYIKLMIQKSTSNVLGINELEVFENLQITSGIGENQKSSTDDINFNIFPNPITDVFALNYNLKAPEYVKVFMSSMDGRYMKLLVDEMQKDGNHHLVQNVSDLKSGLYNITIVTSKYCNNTLILIVNNQ